MCAIKTDQTIACWYRDTDFEDLSEGDVSNVEEHDIPDGRYTAVSVGGHVCAIKTDQTIACWGDNWAGQTDAPAGQYTAIAAGSSSSCAIKTDGTIACWGDRGTDAPEGQYTAVTAPGDFTCAIKTDNTVACWGFIGNPHGGRSGSRLELAGISVGSGSTTIDVRVVDYRLVRTDTPGGQTPGGQTPGGQTPGGQTPGGDASASVEQIQTRDRLVANQESLLNTYRCMFDVDVGAVPGGCAQGKPARGAVSPGVFEGEPTQADILVRDDLIARQEALLNVYRCRFNIDTQLVPGGCASDTT